MPRSTDSFFLRFEQDATGSFTQQSEDLGAFVDALGQSVLRIHNVSIQYSDAGGVTNGLAVDENTVAVCAWQITTQSQDAMITQGDRSMVSCGSLIGAYPKTGNGTATGLTMLTEDASLNPEDFTNGYLIAVEQLYFGVMRNGNWDTDDIKVSAVLECTVEKLSKEAALALALSQQ